MTRHSSVKFRNERGAILIQVAVAMIGLLAFSTLVIDYGIMWMSRRQAQNSADAGALAGAIALAFDDPTDFSDTGVAKQSAHAAVLVNRVFGVAPDNNVSTDITFYGPALPNQCPDGDTAATCVRVDVHRTAARGNPLPTFFARLMSIMSQDISATATAKVTSGTNVSCMRPFAILDKWDEFDAGHELPHDYDVAPNHLDPDYDPLISSFDKYDIPGQPVTLEPDYYVPAVNCAPGDGGCTPVPGTGYRPFAEDGTTPVDFGREVEIHTGAQDQNSAGWFAPVRLHAGQSGAADYCEQIKTCDPSQTNGIGETISTENGNMVGPTDHCLWTDNDSLYSKDTTARWVPPGTPGYPNGAVLSDNYPPNQSPRIIPLPVIDPDEYFASDPNGHTTLVIRNILGFFIERTEGHGGHTVTVGRLINVPSDDIGGSTTSTSSFLRKIILIR